MVGKPAPTLFEQAAKRRSASRPIVIGDRLDTDIEGANRASMESLFVLTGVHRAADLLAAPRAPAADVRRRRPGWAVRAGGRRPDHRRSGRLAGVR